MCPQYLLFSAPCNPSSLRDTFPKVLVQTPVLDSLPKRMFPQSSVKAFGALSFTEQPWLPILFHLERLVPCAKLLKPAFSACRLSQPPQ